MLRRLLGRLFTPHVANDAERLLRGQGPEALFSVRHTVLKAEKVGGEAYWTRVLAEVEGRMAYRPW